MASYTEHLQLLKKDPVADGADTFNIQTMLNDNWDKIDEAVAKKAELGADGKIPADQLPDIDCGQWAVDPVAEHNATPAAHGAMVLDGNNTATGDTSQTLADHMVDPYAHQNLVVDGNAGQ